MGESRSRRSARAERAVVLGAGPAGLAAAYELARAGKAPLVLERGNAAGGLMRSIERNGYRVDVGRKELYVRIPEVHTLWSELLGSDFREYPHRVGVLHGGAIIERSRAFRGFRRGIPGPVLVKGAVDYAARQLANPFLGAPRNEEEYWYRLRGRVFSEVLSQGHAEKFQGHRWADLPSPDAGGSKTHFVSRSLRAVFGRAVAKDYGNAVWLHPARSTGQIIDRLVEGVGAMGGEIRYGAAVTAVNIVDGKASSLTLESPEGPVDQPVSSVVSSVPLDILARVLGREPPKDLKAGDTRLRSTVLVYLFLDEPPRFPHAWLDVTDPTVKAGRITNYAGFNGEMCPPGKSCIALEYFLVGEDEMLSAPNDAALARAIDEASRNGLIDPSKLTDHMVLKLRGAFAADDFRSWLSPGVMALLEHVAGIPNLYNVNRAGTDVATYAGLEAGWGIATGDRTRFDERTDPRRELGIASTRLWS